MDLETAAALDAANANLASWKRLCRKYEEQIRQLKGQAIADQGDIAGMEAMIEALKKELPANNRLLQNSGKVFRVGNQAGRPKSNLRLIYEAGHDAALRKMGISDPVRVRGSD